MTTTEEMIAAVETTVENAMESITAAAEGAVAAMGDMMGMSADAEEMDDADDMDDEDMDAEDMDDEDMDDDSEAEINAEEADEDMDAAEDDADENDAEDVADETTAA